MSWERKLLHCGPRADRRDLLAHYLFISVLHRWLPRGSDHGVSLHRLLVGTGVLDTAARWTDACYWKDNLAAYRSLRLSGDSMRPVNFFFSCAIPIYGRVFPEQCYFKRFLRCYCYDICPFFPAWLSKLVIWMDLRDILYFFTGICQVLRIKVQTVTYSRWVCFEIPLKCFARCHSQWDLSAFCVYNSYKCWMIWGEV